jgi:hypothetical protein
MAFILPGPEESPSPTINGLNNSFRNGHSRHVVKGDGSENGSGEDKPASSIEQGGTHYLYLVYYSLLDLQFSYLFGHSPHPIQLTSGTMAQ